MKHLLNGCPICGGKLYSDEFNQYCIRKKIKKNGELSKTSRKIDVGSMECSIFCCVNPNCNFTTDTEWNGKGWYKNISIFLENRKYYWKDIDE